MAKKKAVLRMAVQAMSEDELKILALKLINTMALGEDDEEETPETVKDIVVYRGQQQLVSVVISDYRKFQYTFKDLNRFLEEEKEAKGKKKVKAEETEGEQAKLPVD